jgi:hypothetical protein
MSISRSPSSDKSFQLVSWHCILYDLVTCLQARICNCHRVGPEYLSVTWMDKSRSWCTRLNLLLWHTQETPFQSPSYVMMVDAIKAASRCSDYVVTSWSKELIILFLSYMQCWTYDWSNCINSALGVFPSCPTWPQCSLTHLSMIRKPWSSDDTWAS